jgi:tetratricopeptide (TPR) repeat protein
MRWALLLVTFALLTPSGRAAACPGEPPTAFSAADQNSFHDAMAAMDQGDFAHAQNLLQTLHARHAGSFEVNEALGLAYGSQSDLTEAVRAMEAAARVCPESALGHANLGTAYLKLQRTHDAIRELEHAAALEPGNARTQEALGQALMLAGESQKAAMAFSAAMAGGSATPDLLYNYALALFNSKKYAKAEEMLAQIPENASSAAAQSLFGDVEEKLGKLKEAAQHYVNAVQLDPSEPNVYLLGVELLRHWTFGPAIKEFSTGVQKFPDSQRMRLGLAVAYYGNENYDQAIQVLNDLLAEAPENSLYAELLARTCAVLAEGMNARCASVIHFAEAHPRNAVVATYAATSILHKPSAAQDLDTAQKLLQSAVAADPRLSPAQFEMGVLLQAQSKWKQSIPPLEAAVHLDPEYAAAHYRLSRAYSHEGRHEQAEEQIKLYKLWNEKQKSDLDARMKEITTLVMKMQ